MDICFPKVMFLVVVMLAHIATTDSLRQATAAYPYDMGGNVSPAIKITLTFLIFGMFLMAFFALYLRRCVQDSPNRNLIQNNHNHILRLIGFPCGLDRSVIQSFPVFTYSDVKHLKIGEDALECAVCISEFADNEQLRFLPKCHHVFHPDCIDAWLASHTTCPVCRFDLTKPSLDSETESAFNHELTQSDHIVNTTIDVTTSPNNDLSQLEEEHVTPKFPRSHSTGHSLVAPGESCERYTLHLPEEVEKQIVTLKRAKSCGSSLEGGSRKGRKWNPDSFCGGSELWNCNVVNACEPITAKNDSVGKSDQAQSSSSSSASLPV